jgi:hypothetical protein
MRSLVLEIEMPRVGALGPLCSGASADFTNAAVSPFRIALLPSCGGPATIEGDEAPRGYALTVARSHSSIHSARNRNSRRPPTRAALS